MTEGNAAKLKPCPFCGGEARLGYFHADVTIDCPHCEYGRDFAVMSDAEAIASWNTRAEPAPMAGVKVKPLEWDDTCGSSTGSTSIGDYDVDEIEDGLWGMWGAYDGYSSNPISTHDTVEEAKAAAQADYERRILAAIEPAPVTLADALASRSLPLHRRCAQR